MNVARDKLTVFTGSKDGGKKKPPSGGGGRYDANDWRRRLILNRDGHVTSTAHNLMLILEHDPDLTEIFWLDEFGNRIALARTPPWPGGTQDEFTEVDAIELAAWLGDPERYSMSAKVEQILGCVEAVARRRKRHSVREYLEGLKWDGKPRLDDMFETYFGAVSNPYTRGCGPCVMVSAVSRILWFDPKKPAQASKVDFMAVLESEQGDGKTTAIAELFSPNWYAEATESPAHKDFFQCLRGLWGVEIGEMESFSKAEVGKIKQVITIRSDMYRASYARTARKHRRECVFVGTTNNDDYLRDASGARRFLPIKVGTANIARIVADRDQLWAEAVHLYRQNFAFWILPKDAKREQDKRYSEDVWTARVIRWLEGETKANLREQLPADRIECIRIERDGVVELVERVRECSIAEILTFAIQLEPGRQNRPESTRVGTILTRLRWPHYRPTHAGERVRFYVRPPPE